MKNYEVNEKGQRVYEGITFGEENKPTEMNLIPFNDRYDLQRSVYNPQTIIEISKIGRVELFEGLEIDVYGDINNTWFLGSDVARLIDYSQLKDGSYDVPNMTRNMDDNMLCLFKVVNDSSMTLSHRTPNLGGNPNKLFINEIEEQINTFGYKTNLVNFATIDNNGKLRYPTNKEIDDYWDNLNKTIKTYNPQKILLLGNIVIKKFEKEFKIKMDDKFIEYKTGYISFIPIYHPSYICVYKKKEIKYYQDKIINLIKE